MGGAGDHSLMKSPCPGGVTSLMPSTFGPEIPSVISDNIQLETVTMRAPTRTSLTGPKLRWPAVCRP